MFYQLVKAPIADEVFGLLFCFMFNVALFFVMNDTTEQIRVAQEMNVWLPKSSIIAVT